MIVETDVPIDRLELLPGNPRRGDVEAIARSLEAFGQRKPVVVNRRDNVVIAGNHTVLAARRLGWPTIAVTWVDDDEATARAFALADNRTAELGDYDETLLARLISDVHEADAELLGATGWSPDDLAALLERLDVDEVDPGTDRDLVPDTAPALTEPGDIWALGDHRLMCGDCRDSGSVARLLEGAVVNLAVTSPPYAEQREYDATSGFTPIKPDDYVDWFEPVAAIVAGALAEDGSWLVNIKPSASGLDTSLYVNDLVAAHVRRWGWHFATEFCWERPGVPKQPTYRLKNQFEPVYQFARATWKFRPDHVRHVSENAIIPLGPGGGRTTWDRWQGGKGRMFTPAQVAKKRRTNATRQGDRTKGTWFRGQFVDGWAYPGNRLPSFVGSHEALGHGAAYPVGLPAFFVRLMTDAGDVVYDPFVGSGSTIIAAHDEGRIGYGMELSPGYVDIACKRFERVTGIVPVNVSTGDKVSFLG